MADKSYDIFISWAHADGEENILQIKREIIEDYKRIAPDAEELKIFTDHDIRKGDDWYERIALAIDHSDLFIAILSPAYFKSKFCVHEFQLWKNHELFRGLLHKASLPVYYIALGEDPYKTKDKMIQEAFLQQSDKKLKPWFNEGQNYMYGEEIKRRIEALQGGEAVRGMLTKVRNHKSSPTNITLSSDFVGRIAELTDIRHKLSELGVRIPILHGGAGVGKTEIAFAYANAYAAEYLGGRFVIKCQGIKSIPDAFVHLLESSKDVCKDLGLENAYNEYKAKNEQATSEEIFENVFKYMYSDRDKSQRTLFIFDNVDNPLEIFHPDLVRKYLSWIPEDTIHILATTRKNSLTTSDTDRAYSYPIQDMAEFDALELLRKKRKFDNPAEETAAKNIISFVGGNAWALAMIAESLKQDDTDNYSDRYDALTKMEESAFTGDEGAIMAGDKAVSTEVLLTPTLRLLNDDERKIADYASLLHPDYVYTGWLKELYLKDSSKTEKGWKKAIRKLSQMHIITNIDDSGYGRMHRLTGYGLRKQLLQDEAAESTYMGQITELLKESFSPLAKKAASHRQYCVARGRLISSRRSENISRISEEIGATLQMLTVWCGDAKNIDLCIDLLVLLPEYVTDSNTTIEQFVSIAKQLLEYCASGNETDIIRQFNLYTAMADAYEKAGNNADCLTYREKVVAICANTFGQNAEYTLKATEYLADSNIFAGSTQEGIELLEKVAKTYKELYGTTNAPTVAIIRKLAKVYVHNGKTQTAIALLEEIVNIVAQSVTEVNKECLAAMQNLAVIYEKIDRDKSLKMFCALVDLSKKCFGEADKITLKAMDELADTYIEIGEEDEGLKLLHEIVEINKKHKGEADRDTLRSIERLAKVYIGSFRRQGIDLEKGTEILQEALRVSEKHYGADDEETLRLKEVLEGMSVEKIEEELSIEGLEKKVSESVQKYGETDKRTLEAKHNLAGHYLTMAFLNSIDMNTNSQSDLEKGLAILNEIIETNEKQNGELANTLMAKEWLADAYIVNDRITQGIEILNAVIGQYKDIYGCNAKKTLQTMEKVAEVYIGKNGFGGIDPEKGIEILHRIVEINKENKGEAHTDTLCAMRELSDAYIGDNLGRNAINPEEGAKVLREIVRINKKYKTEAHPDTLRAMKRLADVYLGIRDRAGIDSEKGNEILEEMLAISEQYNGSEHSDTIEIRKKLAATSESREKRIEKIKLLERQIEVCTQNQGATHEDTIEARKELALLYIGGHRADGGIDPEKGIKILQDIVKIREAKGDAENALSIMRTLANAYIKNGQEEDGIGLLKEIIAKHKIVYGVGEEETLYPMRELAKVYIDDKWSKGLNPEMGIEILREIVQIYKDKGSFVRALFAMEELAEACIGNGREEEGLKLFEEIVKKLKSDKGAEDRETLEALENLANAYLMTNSQEEGLALLDDVLKTREEVYGIKDKETLKAMDKVANAYLENGWNTEGIYLLQKIVEIYKQQNGNVSEETFAAMENLANGYKSAGNIAEATVAFENLCVLIEEHPELKLRGIQIYDVQKQLAECYALSGMADNAQQMREKLLDWCIEQAVLYKDSDIRALQWDSRRSGLLFNLGRIEEAANLSYLILQKHINEYGENAGAITRMNRCAKMLAAVPERLEEALDLQQKCVELSRKRRLPVPKLTAHLTTLAEIYEKLGRADDAQKVRAEIAELKTKPNGKGGEK